MKLFQHSSENSSEKHRFLTDLAAQAFVLMLKEAMVPPKYGVVSKSHTFMLAQASH